MRRALFLGLFLLVAGLGPAQVPATDQVFERARLWEELLARMEAAGIDRYADLPYAAIEGVDAERLSLDVYTTPDMDNAPVVLFVHGGSWQRGSKMAVLRKPLALVPAGYITVSTNYRFRPHVSVAEQAGDVARAVAWIHGHIGRYGGDPERIVLMGHSAGAHLVAVVGTNGGFLEAEGVPMSVLKGVVPLDTGPYNVPLQLERLPGGSTYGDLMRFVFGDDPGQWEAVSPIDHLRKSAAIPAFLVYHADGRRDVDYQARPFVETLREAGFDAELVNGVGKTHGTLNADLGASGEAITEKLLSFLERVTSR